MKKTQTLKKTAALLLGIALTVGATGCNFIVTDGEKDLEQVVATVNVIEELKKDDAYKAKASDVEKVLENLTKEIKKRDLVSMFLSTGYQYVENYGYSYEDTFNMLMDNLVNRKIMIQVAVAYFLQNNASLSAEACTKYVEKQTAAEQNKTKKALLEKYPEVLTLKYFLTEGCEDDSDTEAMKAYDIAEYSLKKSLNNSLDSIESSYISSDDEEHDHAEARTLPTDVDTEEDEYYTTDYDVYTGRNKKGADSCGEYEKQEGSTTATRLKAYNAFLANLQGYNLIGEEEDTKDVTLLEYYYVELSSILGQSLISKYYEALEKNISDKLDEAYMTTKYNETLALQEKSYKNDPTAFDSAMDSASADSFLLYGLNDFGYVYNILLPFSAEQNVAYTEAKNKGLTQDRLYDVRKNLLTNVKGEDQRGSWISMHDHANYSYVKEDGKYYFFDNNVNTTGKYKKLTQYAGNYAYNGTVTEDEDGDEYKTTPNKVSIDDFIEIFENYVSATSGATASGSKNTTTYGVTPYTTGGKTDYGKFTYYTGKVALTDTSAANFFNAESDQYKALSAVNELMFAYSTDTGCLNTYMGYAVSPYGTDFVKEFEYAAQALVKEGVGSYSVCATDYGWHILYCSFKYTGGKVYGDDGYVHADKDTEGTFSNLFYEAMKETAYTDYATEEQNRILIKYDTENCVTRYQKRYQDLLDLDD